MTTIEEQFSAALHSAARAWRMALDRRLKDLGVGQASWLAIANIAKAAQPLSQTELAQCLAVEDPTMVAMLDRLEKNALVVRQPSATDRRVKLVLLTDAGQAIYAKVRIEATAFGKDLLDGIPSEKLAELTTLLELLQKKAESAQ